MDRPEALTHLTEQLLTGAGLPVSLGHLGGMDVLGLLGADGLERVLETAYLVTDEGWHWPTYTDPADLWQIVRRALFDPEPRPVPTCPTWCAEHTTAHRHSILEDALEGDGYTVTHQVSHGDHVFIDATETALSAAGPTLTGDGPQLLLLADTEMVLDPARAKSLAAHLLAAATQLEGLRRNDSRPADTSGDLA